jgi:putative membrane protein
MKQRTAFLRNFNWRILLLRLVINAAVLMLTALVVPKIFFVDRTFVSVLLLAVGLGALNAIVKPVIQVLTLRFIFVSYGLIVILINALILFLLSYFFPQRFAVTGVFWALVGGALIGVAGAVLESLLGVTAPILAESYPELRARIKERQVGGVKRMLGAPLPPLAQALDETAAPGAPQSAETAPEPGAEAAAAQTPAGGEA